MELCEVDSSHVAFAISVPLRFIWRFIFWDASPSDFLYSLYSIYIEQYYFIG
jgi:hypothetical protein